MGCQALCTEVRVREGAQQHPEYVREIVFLLSSGVQRAIEASCTARQPMPPHSSLNRFLVHCPPAHTTHSLRGGEGMRD